MKREPSAARVLLAGVAWRTFGTRRSAETLIRAMAGNDEQNRMLAGMALVKAGERTVDLIERKSQAGEATARLIRLLPDLDCARTRRLLGEMASRDDHALSDTARKCLEQLRRIDDNDCDQQPGR